MRRWGVLGGVVAACIVASMLQSPAGALSLEIRPLEYRTTLEKGEAKKGFIDVTNPTGDKVSIRTEVQAFRQIDNKGSLEFYDSDRVKAGIIPDVASFQLAPGETLRMYFKLDGAKLAAGDTFGALFFRIVPTQVSGVNSTLRLGTLFSIHNGSETDHRAKIDTFDVPFFQFGDTVRGSYSVTNVADPNTTNAFYPEVRLTLSPFEQTTTHTSSLVFAGRTRTNEFEIETLRFGLYTITLRYNDMNYTKLIFVATQWQLLIAALFVAAFLLGAYLLWHRRRLHQRVHYRADESSKKMTK